MKAQAIESIGRVTQVTPSGITVLHKDPSEEEDLTVRIGDYIMVEGVATSYLAKVMAQKHQEDQEDEVIWLEAEIMLGFTKDGKRMAQKGMLCYPSIGDQVYMAPKMVVAGFMAKFGLKYVEGFDHIGLGVTTDQMSLPVHVSYQSLFGRHLAVVGTTGGGKSWTLARLIGEMKNHPQSKMILIDPTGEYKSIEDDHFVSASIGVDTFFHYRYLTTEDLYYLIKPSGNIQLPKLLEAIRSLKALELDVNGELQEYVQNGLVRKANRKKEAFEKFYYEHIGEIENGVLDFDIKYLSSQITQECFFDTDKNHPEKYGNRNDEAVSRCFNLISRTSNMLHTDVFKKAFGFDKTVFAPNEMTKIMDRFFESDKRVLRIGFEGVGFEFQAREIIANAIGKFLLTKARKHYFDSKPCVVFVDEAHQFMNKTVVDDYFQGSSLTAFDQIAKECRKYGLFMCIATQMPRDIPVGTLSQMGTFLVHRLINPADKVSIREACASASKSILEFLPALGEGEAILSGVDLPMDLTLKVYPPVLRPDSGTPHLAPTILSEDMADH